MRDSARPSIPRGVWVLGFVSLLTDISSEMIHALLPFYMVVVLGTSALAVGVIEGIAEATAAFTKPVFPLAPTVGWLVAAGFVDRIGKGIRGAPRDALVADLAPPAVRGAAFGLRQSLDTVGAFAGPLIAIALMWATADAFRTVFWCAVLPAFLAFALIVFGVRDPDPLRRATRRRLPLARAELARLGRSYWWVVAIGAVFTLARFSEAFLVLRAQGAGLPLMWVPVVLVLMNVVYAAGAYPAGALSDRVDRVSLLVAGLAVLIAADLALAWMPGLAGVFAGVAMWGLHMALTQGLLATLVADTAPAELRGTAFGFFNLVSSVALLAASVIAGTLWDLAGPASTFAVGAAFAAFALVGLLAVRGGLRPAAD
jgi:MFS family permease